MSRSALPSLSTGPNERTSLGELIGASYGRPAARNAASVARRRRDADAPAHRSVARASSPGDASRPASACRRAGSSRNRSPCRATPSRLRSSNWPRKAMSPFPPDAVRSVAEGLSLDRRRTSSRSNRGGSARISLSAWARGLHRANWPPDSRRSGRGRFSRGWRMNASFRTMCGAVACGARREMHRCAATGPSTIRRCRKPCSGISWFIAGSRPKPARS